MSYTPTEWKNGDIITAAKMNNIEQGIVDAAGGSFTETDPTVPGWAKQSTKPSYNFSEINNTPTTLEGYGITDVRNSCYDLVIKYDGTYPYATTGLTLVKGNILDLEARMANHEPVTGILYYSYGDSWTVGNTNYSMRILPLTDWFGPYCYLRFGGAYLDAPNSSGGVHTVNAAIGYDKDTGAFTHVYFKIT